MAEITADPTLHAEVRVVAGHLRAAAQPCGSDAVRRALQPLVLVYGMADAARVPAFWGPYLSALADMPVTALKEAIEAYTASPDAEFFPKPGPLKALADKAAEPLRRAASRATTAARLAPPKKPDPPTEAEKERVKAWVADFANSVKAKQKPPAAMRPTHGKIDGTGITAEMRELLNRQRDQPA